MEKTLTESVYDGGKYYVPAGAIALAIVTFALAQKWFVLDEVQTPIVAVGLQWIINFVLTVIAYYLPKKKTKK